MRTLCIAGTVTIAALVGLVGCGSSSTADPKFCTDAQQFANAVPTAGSSGNEQALAMLKQLRAEAPVSLRSDFDTIIRLAASQPSASASSANAEQLTKVYDATTRISTYLTDTCHISTPSTTG